MHKSWGNAIEFDEAAERMGVDVMRWMYASSRPDDNILFGWHAADEARRGLLVLWNVYAFFVTYARLAGWTPRSTGLAAGRRAARRSTAGSCRARRPSPRRSRPQLARLRCRRRPRGWSTRTSTTCPPGTCGCRGAGCARRRPADREAAFATLHAALVALARTVAPILPFLSETIYRNLVAGMVADGARQRPPDRVAGRRARAASATRRSRRRWPWRGAPSTCRARCAARPGSRSASRSPACGSRCPGATLAERDALLDLIRGRGQRQATSSSSATSRSSSTAA